jgi:hypothetical protein
MQCFVVIKFLKIKIKHYLHFKLFYIFAPEAFTRTNYSQAILQKNMKTTCACLTEIPQAPSQSA